MSASRRRSFVDILGLRPRGATTSISVASSSMRFLLVGVANNAVVYGLYSALIYARVDSLIAVTVTFPIGMVLSYTVQRFWSFRQKGVGAQSLVRFLILSGIDYSLNAVLIWVFTRPAQLNPYVAQLLCIALVAGVNFVLMRFWVYRAEAPIESTPHLTEGSK